MHLQLTDSECIMTVKVAEMDRDKRTAIRWWVVCPSRLLSATGSIEGCGMDLGLRLSPPPTPHLLSPPRAAGITCVSATTQPERVRSTSCDAKTNQTRVRWSCCRRRSVNFWRTDSRMVGVWRQRSLVWWGTWTTILCRCVANWCSAAKWFAYPCLNDCLVRSSGRIVCNTSTR
jgi:hypothetical protein